MPPTNTMHYHPDRVDVEVQYFRQIMPDKKHHVHVGVFGS